MSDIELFLRIHFGKCLIIPVSHEHRVITKAAVAARRPDKLTLDSAFEQLGMPVRPGQRQNTDKMRASVRAASG